MTAPFIDPTLPGTSSAIAALLHSLTSPAGAAPLQGAQGATGPGGAPVAPQQPAASPPPAASAPGGITGRIQSLLSHIDPRPQAPPGYEGLLSSEDIQKARPGILASLIGAPGGPSAKEQYENNLNHVVQLHGLATQIAENRRILANRQAIEAKYPLPPNPTDEQIRNNLAQRYDAYIGAGDAEMAKDVGSTLRGIMSAPHVASHLFQDDAGHFQYVPEGGQVPDGFKPVNNATGQAKQLFQLRDGTFTYFGPGEPIPQGAKPVSMVEKEKPPATKYVWATPPGGTAPVYVPEEVASSGGYTQPTKAGAGGGALAGPVMNKVGQFGEMLKKSADIIPMMERLDVKLGQSAANDVAEHGVAHIPGTQGVGSMLVNRWPEYAQYEAALAPWVLSAAHATSGARINQEQAKMIDRSVHMQAGDAPNIRKQRIKNVVDQMNSVAASLPADAVAAQEAQMDPKDLAMLRAYGYKGAAASGKAPAAPTSKASASGRTVVVNGKKFTVRH